MMRWWILNTTDLSDAPEAVAALREVGELDQLPPERSTVLGAIGNYDAYVASAEVRIDEEFMARAKRLKVIGTPSTGTDHMDLEAIRSRDVVVYDIAKEYELIRNFTATSELVFGLLISLVRRLPRAFAAAQRGDWARERLKGVQLQGKTFGILGLGRLGRVSARIAGGLAMRVIACDADHVCAEDVEMVDLDTLLAESDVLSIHIHLTESTRGLIGREQLAKMKVGAILINTSRGAIVDEAALLEFLENGHLGGAGLDVVEGEWREDLRDHPLIAYARNHENLLITPHIGGCTHESIRGARIFIARKLAQHLRGLGDP